MQRPQVCVVCPIEEADRSEVVEAYAAFGCDEQIPRMRIAVKDSENEDLVHIGIHKVLGETRTIRSKLRIFDPPPGASPLNDDRLAGQAIRNIGDVHGRPIRKGLSKHRMLRASRQKSISLRRLLEITSTMRTSS